MVYTFNYNFLKLFQLRIIMLDVKGYVQFLFLCYPKKSYTLRAKLHFSYISHNFKLSEIFSLEKTFTFFSIFQKIWEKGKSRGDILEEWRISFNNLLYALHINSSLIVQYTSTLFCFCNCFWKPLFWHY